MRRGLDERRNCGPSGDGDGDAALGQFAPTVHLIEDHSMTVVCVKHRQQNTL